MSNIFTGNVFLSTSKEAIEKLFFSKNKVSSFNEKLFTLTEEEIAKSVIASPNRNSNLLQFEHQFGYGSKGLLNLKFLESNSLFERYFITASPITALFKRVAGKLLDEINDPSSMYTRDELSELENRLLSDGGEVMSNYKIYFAYGVGDDIRNWSGPHVANLTKANLLTTSEGVREVEMEFNSFPMGMFYSNVVEGKRSRGLEGAINKFSRILTEKNIKIEVSEQLPITSENFSLSKSISSLIRKYINAACIHKQTIVILPEIGYEFKDFIAEKNKLSPNEQGQLEFAKAAFGADVENRSTDFRLETFWAKNRNSIKAFLLKFGINLEDLVYEYFKSSNSFFINSEQSEQLKKYFGINVLPKEQFEYQMASIDARAERTDIPEKVKNYSGPVITIKVSKDDSDSTYANSADPFAPLQKIINGFRTLFTGDGDELELTEESDIRILKLWKKYGFIHDEYSPVVLFGSRRLIGDLLYLKSVINIEESIDRLNSSKYTKEDLDKYFVKGYRLEFYDQFIKTPINSSFGENVLIKDELALGEENASLSEALNIPIFRYNTRNPNVLGVSVDFNQGYIDAYNLGISKQLLAPFINSKATDYAFSLFSKFDPSSIDKFRSLITEDDFSTDQKLSEKINKLIITNDDATNNLFDNLKLSLGKNATFEELQNSLFILLNYSKVKDVYGYTRPLIEVQEDQAEAIQKEIFDTLSKSYVNVTIKTLPFFKLTSPGKKCYLLAITNSLVGLENVKFISPYSRLYEIVSYKHYISTDDMYSEFELIRTGSNQEISEVVSGESATASEIKNKLRSLKSN